MTLDNKDAEHVSLLKCDAKGRVRRSRAQREEILAEFDRSGLSALAFAKLIGVHYQTLLGWKKARAKRSLAPLEPASPLKFLEAAIQETSPLSPALALNVSLPGGVQIQLHHASQVDLAAQLIQSLR